MCFFKPPKPAIPEKVVQETRPARETAAPIPTPSAAPVKAAGDQARKRAAEARGIMSTVFFGRRTKEEQGPASLAVKTALGL